MVLELPYSNDPGQPCQHGTTARRLVAGGNVAIVPRLVEEAEDQDHIKTANSDADPENVLPGTSPAEHKVSDQRSPEWRGDVEQCPQANLASAFMEEEHVLDERDRDCLRGCDEEASECSHSKEEGKIGRNCGENRKDEPQKVGPE